MKYQFGWICILSFGLLGACASKSAYHLVTFPAVQVPEGGKCTSPQAGPNRRITNAVGDSDLPVMVKDGDGFIVAWKDGVGQFPATTFVRIGLDGVVRSQETVLPQQAGCDGQSLAADGNDVYLSWIEAGVVQSVALGGDLINPRVFGAAVESATGGPLNAVAWVENHSLFFRSDGMLEPANRKGELEEPAPVVVARGGIHGVHLAWSGNLFALVWSESVQGGRKIFMQRVTNRGQLAGPKVTVSAASGRSNAPVVLWNGAEFAVAWTNDAPITSGGNKFYRVFLAIVKEQGGQPTFTRQLDFQGSADAVSLASTGEEYALAWAGSKPGGGSAVYMQRFTSKGLPASEIVQVSDDAPVAVGPPSIVWANDGYAVVWHDGRHYEGSEIFYAHVSCNAAPEDAPVEGDASSDDAAGDEMPVEGSEELKSVF